MSGKTAAISAASAARSNYQRATVLALILSGLLTVISLIYPPGLNFDPGIGMLEWRTLAEGGPVNSLVAPDPADISKDRTQFITSWSPGQYLVPGAFTLLGLRIGPALSVTAGLSLLSCLLGWIQVFRRFAVSPGATLVATALLSGFVYSTASFHLYSGGEVLLQAVTPWLILAGCRMPLANPVQAAGLAVVAILLGFFMKLTGVLVAGAALAAGLGVTLLRLRRITAGMIAGPIGVILAIAFLYLTWVSRGPVPVNGGGSPSRMVGVIFAIAAPWGAGIAWMDTLEWFEPALRKPSLLLPILVPPVVFFASAILWGARIADQRSELSELIKITACFVIGYALMMAVLYAHGQVWGMDERYLRPAGTLIFVCAIAVADYLPGRHALRIAVTGFCAVVSLAAIYALGCITLSRASGETDPYSGTRQLKVDVAALEYARDAFTREGRDALFVLPFPDAANAFPPGARLLATNNLEFESDSFLAARKYAGRVAGHVYVLMRTRLARTVKGNLLLQEFTSYPRESWERKQIGDTTVFIQAAPKS